MWISSDNHKKVADDFSELLEMQVVAEDTTSNIAVIDAESRTRMEQVTSKLVKAQVREIHHKVPVQFSIRSLVFIGNIKIVWIFV